MRKLSGITEESLNKEREEILSCSVEDVRKQAPLYQAMLNENSFLTVGNSDKIQENKELFKKIIPLV
jgi:Zn-dependent M16 (insulinase) family peptidase